MEILREEIGYRNRLKNKQNKEVDNRDFTHDTNNNHTLSNNNYLDF